MNAIARARRHEQELRHQCERNLDVLWISRLWTETLGAERVQAVANEHGYGDLRRVHNGHAYARPTGSFYARRLVTWWPTYLLKSIPEKTRSRLTDEARDRDVSVSDVIRQTLCARYGLHCPQASYHYDSRDAGSRTMLLRLQPKLRKALDAEAEEAGVPLRMLILDTLAEQYAAAA